MFCWNCGTKIPDKSKFCMSCGAKIEISNDDRVPTVTEEIRSEQKTETAQSQEPPLQFVIEGTKLEFPASIREYTKRRKEFANQVEPFIRETKEQARAEIEKLNSGNINTCLDIYGAFGGTVSDSLINTVHQKLLHEKIYTISKETIANTFLNSIRRFETEYNSFLDQYMEIISDEEQLQQYRELKRSGRLYWSGGGFNIKGAVVGAAKAGLMNATTGVIHKLGDSIVDALDRRKTYKSKVALLESKDWLRIFETALLEDMYQMYDIYIGLLSKQGKIKVPNLDETLSKTYFRNGKSCTQQTDTILLFLKALQCYPYAGGIYVALSKFLGVANKELFGMYDYFLAPHQIRAYVNYEFSLHFFPKINAIKGSSYDDLDNKISLVDQQLVITEDLKHISETFNDACKPYEQALQNQRKEYLDQRLTSDDGIRFQSVEDLNLYLGERDEYSKYRQETLTRIVPFERQNELLVQAETHNFQNPYTCLDMAQWKTELANCRKAKESYSKSFEEYFFLYWRVKDSDKIATKLPLNVQTMLAKTSYISIARFINVQLAKIKPSSILGPTIEAWFFTSDFYVGVAIPTQSEIHVIQSRDLLFIDVDPERGTLTFAKKDSPRKTIKFLLPDNPNETDMKLDMEFADWIDAVNGALANARKRQNDNLCPVCGQTLFKGAAFCGGCGYKL